MVVMLSMMNFFSVSSIMLSLVNNFVLVVMLLVISVLML